MSFADKLIALLRQQGWSQEELAEKMDVSRQSVSKWESSQSMPDLSKLLQLSELFGVSTDYLLKDGVEFDGNGDAPVFAAPSLRRVSRQDSEEFIALRSEAARRIALGVFLCILSPMGLFAIPAIASLPGSVVSESAAAKVSIAGLLILFLLVAAAVVIFITTGSKSAHFAFLEQEAFELEPGLCEELRGRQAAFRPQYTRCNAIGACLCVLSPVPLLAGALAVNEPLLLFMLCVTLLLAAIGVFFFISAGVRWAAFEKLLREGEYSPKNMETEKLKSNIAGIYWLAVTAGYLAWSFISGAWYKTWIVWPIAGVAFAAIMVICDIVGRDKK